MRLKCGTVVSRIAGRLCLTRVTVRRIIKTLAEHIPDTYFQEAGAKMMATKTVRTPDDNITRVLTSLWAATARSVFRFRS
jgi:hypothetical protein